MRSKFKLRSLLGRRKRRGEVPKQPVLTLAELFQEDPHKARRKRRADLPGFRVTAGDQLERDRADGFADVRLKLREVFTPSQPVADRRMFAGRVGVLTQMIRSIEDQRLHLVLYGERGIGKTSLLHVLADAAREARYIVIYTSCGAASTFDEIFRAAAQDIPLLFHSGYAPTATEAEAGSSLADLLTASKVTPRAFGELCSKLTGTRVLLVLDEFDRSESVEFRRELAELIKILSDRSVRVQLVIAGVAADLADLVEHIPSIRRNILALRVPLMTQEEVQQIVANGEGGAGVTFDAEARDLAVSISHGSPYFASLICHHASLIALEQNRLAISPEDVAAALDQALQELRDRIPKATRVQVDRLLKEGAGKLLAIIAGAALASPGQFELSDLEREGAKAADVARCRRLLDDLAAEDVLFQAHDDANGRRYSFIEEGVAAYLWFVGAQEEHQGREQPPARAKLG